jgi:hypothetical protein
MMKNFILNWRASVKKDVLNENKIIHEASDDEIEVLHNVLSNLDPAELPMNGAFGGKLRKVIPLETVGGKVGEMVNKFQNAGYTVDLKDGTVSYETRREHEGKVYKGKKTLKINKVLNGLLKHKEKERDTDEKLSAERAKYHTERYKVSGADSDKLTDDFNKAYSDYDLEKKKLKEIGKKAFKGMDRYVRLQAVNYYIKAWEENAGFFKNDPEAFAGFSIIISRHPTDVLRMSDFDNIESCHTLASRSGETGAFVKCAYAEAIDGGAIAYVVPSQEIKDWEEENDQSIEDTDDEVLSDSARDIGDIEPVSRVRIRIGRFDDNDYRYYIGVPDARIYGADTSNFYETLKTWLVDNQEGTIQHLPKVDMNDVDSNMYTVNDIGKIDAGKMTLIGGTYQDNPLQQILARMLDPEAKRSGDYAPSVVGAPDSDSSENEIDMPDGRTEEVENEISELVEFYNNRYDYCTIYADVEDYGEGPVIDAYAELWMNLDVGKPKLDDEGGQDGKITTDGIYTLNEGREVYGVEITNDFYNIGGLMWADFDGDENHRAIAYYVEATGEVRLNIDLRPGDSLGSGYVYGVEEFEQFADAIESDIDEKVDPWLKNLMKRTLMREGILESSKFQEFMKQAEEEEFEDFEDTDWSFDVIMDEDRVDIDISVEFKIDDIKGLEDIFYTDQAIKDIGMSRDFGTMFKKKLFDQVPGFVYEESMYPDLTRRYVGRRGNNGAGHARLGLSFTITADHPEGVIAPALSMIQHIKKKDVEEVAKEAYKALIQQNTNVFVTGYKDSVRQQELPFKSEKNSLNNPEFFLEKEAGSESEKSLNERIHRNWSDFLNN